MVEFAPNWAAIAQILGGALAAPPGQRAQGAQHGAQSYQAMQQQQQEQAYRQQQMEFQKQQAEQQTAEYNRKLQQDQQWRDMFGGAQTASATDPFANVSPQDRAMIMAAGRDAGLPMLWELQHQKAQGPESSLGKLAVDLKAGRISQAEYDAAVRKENYIAPQQPQQAPATNLITLINPADKSIHSFDSRDPRVKQLADQGWVERDRSLFPAPPPGYEATADGNGVQPIKGGPADPNRQTETQRNEFKKQSLALDNLEAALSDYEAKLNQYGSVETYGQGKGELENAYANVLIQAKEAANLGALTGPDMEIMGQTVIAPNSMGQMAVGGATGVKGQINSFRGQLKTKRNNLNKLYAPGGGSAAPAADDPLGIR